MDATLAQRSSVRAIAGWTVVVAALGLVDLHRSTKHDGSTMSECIRQVVRTNTPAGRAVFLFGLEIFARHILR